MGLTVDKQSDHETSPSGLVAHTAFLDRNVPDTPFLSDRSDMLSDLCGMTSPLLDTPRGVLASPLLPSPPPPLITGALHALCRDTLRTEPENTTPSRPPVPNRSLPPLQELPAKVYASDRLTTVPSTQLELKPPTIYSAFLGYRITLCNVCLVHSARRIT